MDNVPQQAKQLLNSAQVQPQDPASLSDLFSAQGLQKLGGYLLDQILSPLRYAAVLLTVILLCAVLYSMRPESGAGGNVLFSLQTAAVLVCMLTICAPVLQLIADVTDAIQSSGIFLASFVPVFTAVLIAAMRTGTAAAVQPLLFFASQAVARLGQHVVTPLASAYLALGAAGGVSGGIQLKGLTDLVKKAATLAVDRRYDGISCDFVCADGDHRQRGYSRDQNRQVFGRQLCAGGGHFGFRGAEYDAILRDAGKIFGGDLWDYCIADPAAAAAAGAGVLEAGAAALQRDQSNVFPG